MSLISQCDKPSAKPLQSAMSPLNVGFNFRTEFDDLGPSQSSIQHAARATYSGSHRLQRSINSQSTGRTRIPSVVNDTLRYPGTPLSAAVRDLMEPRFGVDLGGVRIHTDQNAAASAEAIQASAYTVGNHIVSNEGKFRPDTNAGMRLLAHELTHTIQQGATRHGVPALQTKLQADPVDSSFEREADRAAADVMSGRSSRIFGASQAPAFAIQGKELDAANGTGQGMDSEFVPPAWVDSASELLTRYAGDIGELAIGFVPVVGDLYDVVTAILGRTLISNDTLDVVDRLLSLAGLIPIPFISGKLLRSGRSILEFTLKKLGFNPFQILAKALRDAAQFLASLWNRARRKLEALAERHPMLDVFDQTGAVGKDISGIKAKNKNRRRKVQARSEKERLASFETKASSELEDFMATRKRAPQPELRPLHPDSSLEPSILTKYGKWDTQKILDSLLPGKTHSLKVTEDGLIKNGHHRIKVLLERGGINVNNLPRELVD